ncbi:MAG TPA: citrate synthase family protein [Vicinamibacterales bacterium]|nr:citrate synthase family protein [Vicinamibacterales bacterium]
MSAAALWLSAGDACRLLGVNRATLYAYVSRGRVRSQPQPGTTRERRYSREDVERLRRHTAARRDPDQASKQALQWGTPVLESALTLIDGARLYYRGHDALRLARTRSVAEVASLLWTGRFDVAWPRVAQLRVPRAVAALPFAPRTQALLAAAADQEAVALDLRPERVARTGWRILHLMTAAATLAQHPADTIDSTLGHAWKQRAAAVDVIRCALILLADHELNVSSFTARCVASAGSHPYAVVIAAMSALEGPRHGATSARVESMLRSLRHARSARAGVTERLRHGEALEGFGHPLYRDGDPRAAALLDLLQEHSPKSPELPFVRDVADAAWTTIGERPNVDFALAALARILRLPPGAPLMLFAIGRTIGWIGHAIEQYGTGQLIRPRAQYVGVVPA